MKSRRALVPKAAPKPKTVADDTIYLTPKGYRVRIDKSVPPDPITGTKVREVANGKWWYVKPGTVLIPEQKAS